MSQATSSGGLRPLFILIPIIAQPSCLYSTPFLWFHFNGIIEEIFGLFASPSGSSSSLIQSHAQNIDKIIVLMDEGQMN